MIKNLNLKKGIYKNVKNVKISSRKDFSSFEKRYNSQYLYFHINNTFSIMIFVKTKRSPRMETLKKHK
jgi:hypothetical protein